MTIKVRTLYDVKCDGPSCSRMLPASLARKDAERRAVERGWELHDGYDYCERCAEYGMERAKARGLMATARLAQRLAEIRAQAAERLKRQPYEAQRVKERLGYQCARLMLECARFPVRYAEDDAFMRELSFVYLQAAVGFRAQARAARAAASRACSRE